MERDANNGIANGRRPCILCGKRGGLVLVMGTMMEWFKKRKGKCGGRALLYIPEEDASDAASEE